MLCGWARALPFPAESPQLREFDMAVLHLLVSNNDGINPDPNQPSEIVEFTTGGHFVKQLSVDPAQGGAFGLAVFTIEDKAIFAAVDDNTASLLVWTVGLD
jgi:hypothetical protein